MLSLVITFQSPPFGKRALLLLASVPNQQATVAPPYELRSSRPQDWFASLHTQTTESVLRTYLVRVCRKLGRSKDFFILLRRVDLENEV
jgi:hypothetical protein